jgi:hypothetical protein
MSNFKTIGKISTKQRIELMIILKEIQHFYLYLLKIKTGTGDVAQW